MSTAVFASVLAAGFAFIASLFFCIGTARLSNETVYLLAGTYYGGNRGLFEALAQQRADYLCGTILLPVSFLIQVLVLTVPSLSGYYWFASFGAGVGVAIFVFACVVILALIGRSRLMQKSREHWSARMAAQKAAEEKS